MQINLQTAIQELPKVGEKIGKKLNKLGIHTINDLLFYFPSRYEDYSNIIDISKLKNPPQLRHNKLRPPIPNLNKTPPTPGRYPRAGRPNPPAACGSPPSSSQPPQAHSTHPSQSSAATSQATSTAGVAKSDSPNSRKKTSCQAWRK